MKIPAIEKGVPIPARKPFGSINKGKSKKQLFLKSLQIGDSFVAKHKTASNNWATAARQLGLKLSCRTGDDGVIRLWRIA